MSIVPGYGGIVGGGADDVLAEGLVEELCGAGADGV
jgi:hypothetical protein